MGESDPIEVEQCQSHSAGVAQEDIRIARVKQDLGVPVLNEEGKAGFGQKIFVDKGVVVRKNRDFHGIVRVAFRSGSIMDYSI